MFEVGKQYEFRIIEGGDEISFHGTVERYEHPLLKLADTQATTIQMVGLTGGGEADSVEDLGTFGPYPGRIINITHTAEEKRSPRACPSSSIAP